MKENVKEKENWAPDKDSQSEMFTRVTVPSDSCRATGCHYRRSRHIQRLSCFTRSKTASVTVVDTSFPSRTNSIFGERHVSLERYDVANFVVKPRLVL